MSIYIRPDGTGRLMAQLKCDACSAHSVIYLLCRNAFRTLLAIEGIRRWMRRNCEGSGWAQLSTIDEGLPFIADLCPRCAEKTEAVLNPTGS